MTKVCKKCGMYINPVYGEWWDEYDMAECYSENTAYQGPHEPVTYSEYLEILQENNDK